MNLGTRRGILLLGGAALLVATLPRLWGPLRPVPPAVPHPLVAGFRLLDTGPVSGGRMDPFAGLQDPDEDRIEPVAVSRVCPVLYREPAGLGQVQVAMFTDINCPYCREMQLWLAEAGDGISLSWHDYPRLGPGSVAAARAIGAAGRQGAADEMRRRLHRTRFQADTAYVTAVADGIGLDAERLLADMQHPDVEREIGETIGLAHRFALPGTPALFVGGTVAIGRRSEAEFAQLVSLTASADLPSPCR